MLRLLDGANDALPKAFRGPQSFGLLLAAEAPWIDPYPDTLVLTDTRGRVLMDGLTAIAVHEAA